MIAADSVTVQQKNDVFEWRAFLGVFFFSPTPTIRLPRPKLEEAHLGVGS